LSANIGDHKLDLARVVGFLFQPNSTDTILSISNT